MLLYPGLGYDVTDNALIILSAIMAIWTFVELGLRRGITGGNIFGDDPLQR
jgi:hypothetical protein